MHNVVFIYIYTCIYIYIESDLEMYETNGEDWVLRDMEGSDLFTRRRGAVDLVRALCECFEEQMAKMIMPLIQSMTEEYESNKAEKFPAMDAVINLMLAMGVKKSTRQFGATEISTRIPIFKFFERYIIPELKEKSKAHDIIRADALKFIVIFRTQWETKMFLSLLSLACKFLKEKDYVLHTYAAIAIEKIVTLRVNVNMSESFLIAPSDSLTYTRAPFKYPKEELLKHLKPVIENLFYVLEKHQESHTNEYVMSTILLVIQRAQEGLIAVVGPLLQQSKKMLLALSKNPQKPRFTHCLFETIAASIYYICKSDSSKVDNFERELMDTFFQILGQTTCTEFHPYVFQLMAMMLRLRTKITQQYVDLFEKILSANLWHDQGTIEALSGMFEDYLQKVNVDEFVTKARLEKILSIFATLLNKRTQDFQAFRVLKAVFQFVPKFVSGFFF
ncbi:hypothetical protein RFI_29190 [Reticulomyxa filosa]|uniref:Uncharacterized protein n=1 Tax=Reticulomyxa filosa TaxID=46433 RepID=X6M590_RETFI|nr:hypothetical protein RFI_29190 [Reticulomyxa filosa]|eukprot:ETO08200.1 hypothetical protein RFI_29190 [Reticulomyxa filosa]